MKSLRLPIALTAALMAPIAAHAVLLTGNQTAPGTWTYGLTLAPLDNYSIFPTGSQGSNLTTITLTGLSGVTGATGPSSTDFPGGGSGLDLNLVNLAWTSAVLNGGTEVQWTHVGPGTGNFGTNMHISGFQIFASGAVDGSANYSTSGFSRDTTNPLPGNLFNVDVTGAVRGPVAATTPGNPVPEPTPWMLLAAGLMGARWIRRRS